MYTVNVFEINEWETIASAYQPAEQDNFRITKKQLQRGYHIYHGMDGCTFFYARQNLTITALQELKTTRQGWPPSWHDVMVDMPPDYRAMQKYAKMSYGSVLTSGLGLGLVLNEMTHNDRITDIYVVEKSPNVMELMKPYLHDDSRVNIINSDFFDFINEDNREWDFMLIDLWTFWGSEQQLNIYKENVIPMNEKLKSKYPKTQILFHGFCGMPDIIEIEQAYERGDDIDPLIYGLQECV